MGPSLCESRETEALAKGIEPTLHTVSRLIGQWQTEGIVLAACPLTAR